MNKYVICVTETSRAFVTVEANTSEEAASLFSSWLDDEFNQQEMNNVLEDCYEGLDWNLVSALPRETPDITYEELKQFEAGGNR